MRTAFSFCIAAFALQFSVCINAATYVVNTLDVDLPDSNTALANCDSNPGVLGDQCTLRAAVMQANAGAGSDTIVLPLDSTIVLNLGGIGGAESGDLDITAPLIITGVSLGPPADSSSLPLINASFAERIFDIGSAVAVELRGMRLSGGAPSGAAGSNGGALRITNLSADVLVDRVRFSDNEGGNGAAIFNNGTLLVTRSDFSRNRTSALGSAIYNSRIATVRDSSMRNIRDSSGQAEALYTALDSTLVVENSLINGQQTGIGITPTGGIVADRPSLLSVRNSTLVNFSEVAVAVIADASTGLRLFNSIFDGSDDTDCRITTVAGPPPSVIIDYNRIRDSECGAFAGEGNFANGLVLLEPLTSPAESLVFFQRPQFGSAVIDRGIPPDAVGGEPGRFCLAEDQLGMPRPQDGDADGQARCDVGAIEASTLTSSTYTVNLYSVDLPDINPGDNSCDVLPVMIGDQCTLRAAVMEANAKAGPDRIEFINDGENLVTLTIDGLGDAAEGDLDVTEQLTIDGLNSNGLPLTTVTSNIGQRLFDVNLADGQRVNFENLRMLGGQTAGQGGAVRMLGGGQVNILSCELVGNGAALGGGALAILGPSVLVNGTDIHDNSANTRGAAIYATSLINLTGSSVWGNSNGDGAERESVRIEGASNLAVIFNSTLSGNSGGIWIEDANQLNLRASTIVDNAQFGLRAVNTNQIEVRSSIISGNGSDCLLAGAAVMEIDNYNFVGNGGCSPGTTNLSGNPLLAPALSRFDGQVSRVRVPLAGSPVLDAVPAGGPGGSLRCLNSDQYNQSRPTDTDGNGTPACEIGALELTMNEAAPKNFVVNLLDQDLDDSNPGDTRCDTSVSPGEQCTLRAALMEANALPGANSIQIVSPGATVLLTQSNLGGGVDASHGDLDITDSVAISAPIDSPAARALIQSSSGDRIFNISAPGDVVSFSGLRLSGGNTTGSGGALRVISAGSVLVDRVEMFANTADQGGGAVSVVGGTVVLDRVDLHNNGTAGDGAAIRNNADLTVNRSSISNNLDLQAAGLREAVAGVGGGTTRIVNSTLSGNNGDAVRIIDGSLEVENSTLAFNDNRGVSYERVTGRGLLLRNSAFGNNLAGGCLMTGGGNASISTNGFNLSQSNGCEIHLGASNLINANTLLGELVLNPSEFSTYHPPMPGSPLIDSGHNLMIGMGCQSADQRGTARPIDGNGDGESRCDIGAIEASTVVLGDDIFANGFED